MLVRDAAHPLGDVYVDQLVRRVQARTKHLLEPAHVAAFLLNPRRRSSRYVFGVVDEYDAWLVRQAKRYFLSQCGFEDDSVAYMEACDQFTDFHMQRAT